MGELLRSHLKKRAKIMSRTPDDPQLVEPARLAILINKVTSHPERCPFPDKDCLLCNLAEEFFDLAAELLDAEPEFPFEGTVPIESLCRPCTDSELEDAEDSDDDDDDDDDEGW